MYTDNKVVDIQLLNIEDHGSNVLVNYTKIFADGTKKTYRTHVKDLGGYYQLFSPKPIATAICLGKVYVGFVKSDCRILFTVKLEDGSAQLIQAKEGSSDCLRLLQLSEETMNGVSEAPPVQRPNSAPIKPYPLDKNELPQGRYLIGRDIPPGVYDFFAIYGTGGKFDIAKYDANDKLIDGTRNFYWVGLTETYEHRELIHIDCKAGYTVKISGNVILKIARSQGVRIEL